MIKINKQEVNIGKAPGLDRIHVKLFLFWGDNTATAIHKFILAILHGDPIPQDWVYAIMPSIYKGKKAECGNYHSISPKC